MPEVQPNSSANRWDERALQMRNKKIFGDFEIWFLTNKKCTKMDYWHGVHAKLSQILRR